MNFQKIAGIKDANQFTAYLKENNIEMPFDTEMEHGYNPILGNPIDYEGKKIGNRFCILAMEGWDCPGGHPSEMTRFRWRKFGMSGAKLIWGGEAAAVMNEGRSNLRQLMICEETLKDIASMRQELVDEHKKHFATADDLFIGLQLTHSGRFSKPINDKKYTPSILYHHPILDRKFGLDKDYPLLTDSDIRKIISNFIKSAELAWKAGFDFVDVKHCHGYLGHEFLSAFDRPGDYGGSFENRTRFLREIVQGIRSNAPQLKIGVRLSVFDFVPFKKGPDDIGIPETFEDASYKYAFGGDGTGLGIDLTETLKFLELLKSLGIKLVCATAGSPYYNPHIQRPALYPPCDGYLPPEDPLKGVARQIKAVAELKKKMPEMLITGSAYTYLQEWFPNVAQAVIRNGMADFVGLGRMVLPYPEMPADILGGKKLQRCKICRTFSDCTTAPRNGLISGCYPLDEYYKKMPDCAILKEIKNSTAIGK